MAQSQAGIYHDPLEPTQQLNTIKRLIVTRIVPEARDTNQQRGVLGPDPVLLVRNRGTERRRDLSTLPGAVPFLRIGTRSRPLRFTWVADGNWQVVFEAAQQVYNLWYSIAPVRTGFYRASGVAAAGGRGFTPGTIPTGLASELGPDDRLVMLAGAEYASVLEANARGGLLLQAVRRVRKRFGTTVAMRFVFANTNARGGLRLPVNHSYAVPYAEFGLAGAFASTDTRGRGTKRRERNRAARRAGRS